VAQVSVADRDSVELSPFLRQTVETQNSANGMKIPSNAGLSHGFVSTAVHAGVKLAALQRLETGAPVAEVAQANQPQVIADPIRHGQTPT
jgi:hypothetical protein